MSSLVFRFFLLGDLAPSRLASCLAFNLVFWWLLASLSLLMMTSFSWLSGMYWLPSVTSSSNSTFFFFRFLSILGLW